MARKRSARGRSKKMGKRKRLALSQAINVYLDAPGTGKTFVCCRCKGVIPYEADICPECGQDPMPF